MAKKKAQPQEAPRKIDIHKKAALEKQLHELKAEKKAVSAQLTEEREFVNRSENSQTDEISPTYLMEARLANLTANIKKLEDEIRNNCFIDNPDESTSVDPNAVNIGDTVTILIYGTGGDEDETIERTLVAANANTMTSVAKTVSITAPLGRAIYRHCVGEQVEVAYVLDNMKVSYLAKILSKK